MSVVSIHSRGRDVLGFLGQALVVALIAAAGRSINADAIPGWYTTLAQPPITPPNWLFAPVWSSLYLMMAVSAWMIWRRVGLGDPSMIVYWLQLALNLLWTVLFFGMQSPLLAGIEILVLIAAIAMTICSFAEIHRPAAWLLVPYLAWTSFAAVLTWWFWAIN
jgi:tryptophan-rich sensory protein